MEHKYLGALEIGKAEFFELHQILSAGNDSMPLTALHGFLVAIVSSTADIRPAHWLPHVLGKDYPYISGEHEELILDLLTSFHNFVINSFLEDRFELIGVHNNTIYTGPMVTDDIIKQWCKGYMEGVDLDGGWNEVALTSVFPISVLAEKFELIGETDTDGNVITDDSKHRENYRKILPDLVYDIYFYAMKQRESKYKVGRNAHCSCGSGLKFKKCCLNNQSMVH